MRTRRTRLTLVVLACACIVSALPAAAQGPEAPPKASKAMDQAKAAMRARQFDGAAGMLAKIGGPEAAEAAYLRALALYYARKDDQAVAAADVVITKHAKSPWFRKARFLKAAALVRRRKFAPAEAIYADEANRLLSEARKQETAGVIIKFADALAAKPKADDVGAPPPNYAKAYKLYGTALSMEIGRDLRDEVMYKRARAIHQARNYKQAVADYRAYLAEFDPQWTGNVGSVTRLSGQKRDKPKGKGGYVFPSRYHLGVAQLAAGDNRSARVNLEDLQKLIAAKGVARSARPPWAGFAGDVAWQLLRTYRLPNPAGNELDRAVKEARDFLVARGADPHAVAAAWWIAEAYRAHGRADQAIEAYEAFIAAKAYKLPDGEAATTKLELLEKSPAELKDEWTKLAVYQIGQIRFGQKKYADAHAAWQSYVNKYPNGPQWASCQVGIINAEFQVAVDAVAERKYDEGRKAFEAFLTKHPLDSRAKQILFTLGQIDYARAQKLEEDKGPRADIEAAYRQAIERWNRLVGKYPGATESSLALYRVGVIHEEKLGDLTAALEAYRRLTWGSYASQARQRVAVMTQKHLAVRTERKFRTNEAPKVKVNVRNIEKLTFKQYFLDLEAYFRKTHAIGRMDLLDTDLIQPDKTWEVKVDKYAKYTPLEQEVDIPFAKGKAGVCIVSIADDDLEAVTLVIRSDIDLIVRTSRREALVFVQNMRANKGVAGARVLLSDGKKVFSAGVTDPDGVFKGRFDELKDVQIARVFAVADGSVASNVLPLQGLGFSKPLAARGYIYTDRPTYQPGQDVKFRGIIRDVAEGQYVAPAGKAYMVTVTDASGRLIWETEQKLSQFGTFNLAVPLDGRAALGQYTITATSVEKKEVSYSGRFQVQRFKLEKMRVKLATDRKVYFRGEKVKLTIRGEYYWGQSVSDKQIRYTLPDGRQYVEKVDKTGKLVVTYDTSGMQPGRVMVFAASIEGENVSASHAVVLAKLGFGITVKPSRPLALAGEDFDVEVRTAAPDGKAVGREMTLYVLRRQKPKVERVLSGVPWISAPSQPAAEVTVKELKVATDKKTGKATVSLKLDKGGVYFLRVSGEDRFKQVVTAQGYVLVSDDEDATKLRLFAKTDTLQVGGKAAIRLHSRIDANLALLTFEGETILDHKVVPIKKGYNPIALGIEHKHFPNFSVAVAAIDGRDLRTASRSFRVERELKVTVKPLADVYAPGAKGKVEITVTDQLGKPVRGELSLALIDEALFAVYRDTTPNILGFFQAGAYRHAEFRVASTCSFAYSAETRKVVKAHQEEQERLARSVSARSQLQQAAQQQLERQVRVNRQAEISRRTVGWGPQSGTINIAGGGTLTLNSGQVTAAGTALWQNAIDARANFGTLQIGGQTFTVTGDSISNQIITLNTDGTLVAGQSGAAVRAGITHQPMIVANLANISEAGATVNVGGGADAIALGGTFLDDIQVDFMARTRGEGEGRGGARREVYGVGRWLGAIVTDKDGKAVVELPMPENTTRWRLTARGCTVETLVGQATGNVVTRKDFFVALKAPGALQEGDTVRFLARVHNLTDYEGKVDLVLSIFGGEKLAGKLVEHKGSVKIDKKGSAELLFEGFEAPLAAAVKIVVSAKAGEHTDALTTALPIRPWGLEFADQGGGVASGDANVAVELPPKRKYASKWMTIHVGPDLKRSVITMALGRRWHGRPVVLAAPSWGGFAGSDLLAAVAGLKYARAVSAPADEIARLTARTRSLVGALVVSQRSDGGWSWTRGKGGTDWAVSAMSFWALCRAKDQGLKVHPQTLTKAQAYLKQTFSALSANDNDAKAVILHAMSANGAADFAHANRLHRERNSLSAPALAYTALAFANLKRDQFAIEILDVLAKKAKPIKRGSRAMACWDGSPNHPWLDEQVEATAIAAMAMMRVKPASPQVKQAVDFLMERHGTYGFVPAKAKGPAVGAIAAYFAKGKFAKSDYKLTVLVNGKEFKTIVGKAAAGEAELLVPANMLADGRNSVDFRMNGRGQYAYSVTLRGFSSDLTDPKSWDYPEVKKRDYYHDTLRYRGRGISAASTSPVSDVEVGQRVKVHVDVYYKYYPGVRGYRVVEEHLPAGMMLVAGSLTGQFVHHEIQGSKIVMYFPPDKRVDDFRYELVGYATGKFRALPTVIRDSLRPGRMRIGAKADLAVLKPGEASNDKYVMNDSERYALGQLNFNDGRYKEARGYLADLFARNRGYNEREVARMLLWIHTSKAFYDSREIVKVFEVLRERYPLLEIPYDKILAVGRAYRDIGEPERAYLVYRATIDASFVNDLNVSAVLEDEGQFLGSVDYQKDLWREYPDTAQVSAAYFALSQSLFSKAPKAAELAKQERQISIARGAAGAKDKRKPDRIEMLKETIGLLSQFLTMYPESPLADDAGFSTANALLDLKLYSAVVTACDAFKTRFAKGPDGAEGEFVSGFQYMIALGRFWQRQHAEALTAAKVVADGKSKDRDFARYIVGQIYHAEGKAAEAIEWYRKVAGKYADAKQAIGYFEERRIKLDEVSIFRPGKPVELKLTYRNIAEASFQVYRVDLMKLYLREKNLANITKVNLAGIKPQVELKLKLGDGKDYVDKTRTVALKLKNEGAYLVICRGDDLFTSALTLVTPLKIEVQEDATSGRVRANVLNAVTRAYVPEVHVKAVGSKDSAFKSGETDLRGIYVADGVRGKATVIAREGDARYAFYRGTTWLGAPEAQPATRRPAQPSPGKPDYYKNIRRQNFDIQDDNIKRYEKLRRGTNKGVEVQRAE